MQPDELRKVLADNLKARRKELGLTQKAVADALGVTQPYIADLERGAKSPRLEVLANLSNALRTTPSALVSQGIFSELST